MPGLQRVALCSRAVSSSLGALFRSKRTSRIKQNLMVFIRSTIIKGPAKARRLSQSKYNLIRNLQNQAKDGSDNPLGPVLVPYE